MNEERTKTKATPNLEVRVRAGTVCESGGRVLLVRLKDPLTSEVRLFPPGGAVEKNESLTHAAQRETLEETGYRVRILPASQLTFDYLFDWGGARYSCRTHLFRAELIASMPAPIMGEPEFHQGVVWLSRDKIGCALDFHKEIKDAVLKLLGGK